MKIEGKCSVGVTSFIFRGEATYLLAPTSYASVTPCGDAERL